MRREVDTFEEIVGRFKRPPSYWKRRRRGPWRIDDTISIRPRTLVVLAGDARHRARAAELLAPALVKAGARVGAVLPAGYYLNVEVPVSAARHVNFGPEAVLGARPGRDVLLVPRVEQCEATAMEWRLALEAAIAESAIIVGVPAELASRTPHLRRWQPLGKAAHQVLACDAGGVWLVREKQT